jgi:hypothetical protein
MMNNYQKIKLDYGIYSNYVYCTFNLKGKLILHYSDDESKAIFIYSTQAKNNKWNCKNICKIPEDYVNFIFINISKYDKLCLFSNNSIYEWDLITEKCTKILVINEGIKYNDWELKNMLEKISEFPVMKILLVQKLRIKLLFIQLN